jgi:hypothetical protein
MINLPSKNDSQQMMAELPMEVQEELTNLRGFRDLMAERQGYRLGRKAKQAEMNEASKKEREVLRDHRKELKEKIPEYIENSDLDGYQNQQKQIKEAKAKVATKQEPFRKKIKPLTKAVNFIDNVAVPASLEQLGAKVQPRFTLSKFIADQIEAHKKSK